MHAKQSQGEISPVSHCITTDGLILNPNFLSVQCMKLFVYDYLFGFPLAQIVATHQTACHASVAEDLEKSQKLNEFVSFLYMFNDKIGPSSSRNWPHRHNCPWLEIGLSEALWGALDKNRGPNKTFKHRGSDLEGKKGGKKKSSCDLGFPLDNQRYTVLELTTERRGEEIAGKLPIGKKRSIQIWPLLYFKIRQYHTILGLKFGHSRVHGHI